MHLRKKAANMVSKMQLAKATDLVVVAFDPVEPDDAAISSGHFDEGMTPSAALLAVSRMRNNYALTIRLRSPTGEARVSAAGVAGGTSMHASAFERRTALPPSLAIDSLAIKGVVSISCSTPLSLPARTCQATHSLPLPPFHHQHPTPTLTRYRRDTCRERSLLVGEGRAHCGGALPHRLPATALSACGLRTQPARGSNADRAGAVADRPLGRTRLRDDDSRTAAGPHYQGGWDGNPRHLHRVPLPEYGLGPFSLHRRSFTAEHTVEASSAHAPSNVLPKPTGYPSAACFFCSVHCQTPHLATSV